MGQALILALADTLGDKWTPAYEASWRLLYDELSADMVASMFEAQQAKVQAKQAKIDKYGDDHSRMSGMTRDSTRTSKSRDSTRTSKSRDSTRSDKSSSERRRSERKGRRRERTSEEGEKRISEKEDNEKDHSEKENCDNKTLPVHIEV
jgi:nucleosome binding factor SPN SPT16 subunit